MKLYTYYRSSASYRVRIALNLKGIAYTPAAINLLKAEQKGEPYRASNPQGLIPALELDDGTVIAQSTAILEWLEETYPDSGLFSTNPLVRAQERSLSNHIACDIHPLLNLGVQKFLLDSMEVGQAKVDQWYSHWIDRGFTAIEQTVSPGNGRYCLGDDAGMADCYLIPQVYNALRFKVDLSAYPTILSIYNHCNTLEAFHNAHPDQQSDHPGQS